VVVSLSKAQERSNIFRFLRDIEFISSTNWIVNTSGPKLNISSFGEPSRIASKNQSGICLWVNRMTFLV